VTGTDGAGEWAVKQADRMEGLELEGDASKDGPLGIIKFTIKILEEALGFWFASMMLICISTLPC
jgi:hypothetical protein